MSRLSSSTSRLLALPHHDRATEAKESVEIAKDAEDLSDSQSLQSRRGTKTRRGRASARETARTLTIRGLRLSV
jgi:hypothetical protein